MKSFFFLLISSFSALAQAQAPAPSSAPAPVPNGILEVRGEAGPQQIFARVKAVSCSSPTDRVLKSGVTTQKRNCSAPVYLDLNAPTEIPAGKYIVGFENTIYPGFVEVKASETTSLDLVKIQMTGTLAKEQKLRVYRDFSSLVEQKKIYFSLFYTGRQFFKLTNRYSFGDYYLTDGGQVDSIQFRNFDYCQAMGPTSQPREQVTMICDSWNHGKSMLDMADLFKFESLPEFEGQFQEAIVSEPGDVQAVRHLKHLVSAPFLGSDFISVFPGVYRVSVDGKPSVKSIRIATAGLIENYEDTDLSRDLRTSIPDPKTTTPVVTDQESTDKDQTPLSAAATCSTANSWRTELRSYCTSDRQEGCDRTQALKCEVLRLDLRFRKY